MVMMTEKQIRDIIAFEEEQFVEYRARHIARIAAFRYVLGERVD